MEIWNAGPTTLDDAKHPIVGHDVIEAARLAEQIGRTLGPGTAKVLATEAAVCLDLSHRAGCDLQLSLRQEILDDCIAARPDVFDRLVNDVHSGSSSDTPPPTELDSA